jgi:hypothetical protein
LVPAAASARSDVTTVVEDGVRLTVSPLQLSLSNGLVERVWNKAPYGTRRITDQRTGLSTGASPDFRLRLADGVELTGADFTVTGVTSRDLPRGGLELTMVLTGAAGTVTRSVAAYPGVAGFAVRTTVALPVALAGYTLDEIALPQAAPTLHAFNAGYDWRGSDTPDWEPAFAPFGGAHTGQHRETRSAAAGKVLEGEGEWLSLDTDNGQAFQVLERADYASSRVGYDGSKGGAAVDLNQDVIYLGPFESDVHFANPNRAPVRYRTASPLKPLALEPVFTGLAIDGDDEPWQFAKYLQRHRAPRWGRGDITFNSNGVDDNVISTGAKDDMNFAEVARQAAIAKRLGVDTFILDDGWQAISGDWCPDSTACPEPRNGTDPKFAPRFPDDHFGAVRDEIGDMKLGLWMSPMHFHPKSEAAERNPGWICAPAGAATAALSIADPNTGSNDAGLGAWNPEGMGQDGTFINYLEGRISNAIDNWGVRYFKFDFLAWIDCAGAQPVTLYEHRESFLRMLDRLIAQYPHVTFQIDETNDYRMFPFESVSRGPSWYANGNPKANELLHNLWLLAPYVPGYTIGQATLGGHRGKLSTDYLMAIALGSHMTFFTDLTKLPEDQITTAAAWADIYHQHRDRFASFTYPLLDDPISGKTWTALQPWDADDQTGALMVYRQDNDDATRTVALRGIRGDGSYRLTDVTTGETFGQFTAEQLRSGIEISLPQRHSAKVLLIDPVS